MVQLRKQSFDGCECKYYYYVSTEQNNELRGQNKTNGKTFKHDLSSILYLSNVVHKISDVLRHTCIGYKNISFYA